MCVEINLLETQFSDFSSLNILTNILTLQRHSAYPGLGSTLRPDCQL